MPNFDGTGPTGQGPLTGQGQGPCAKKGQADSSGANNGKTGYGSGFGKGRRAGCQGRGFLNNPSLSLEEQEKFLENRLAIVRKLKKNTSSQE